MKRSRSVLVCCVLLCSCDLGFPPGVGDDTSPPLSGMPLAPPVVLRTGEEVFVPLLGRRLRFLDVPEDSRCPIDAVCVWEGNARVQMRISGGSRPSLDFELNTSRTVGPREFVLDGIRLVLTQVLPAPRAAVPVPPDAYVVTISLLAAH